ncbi:unnamed protein product [Polarella glacialis]|uniref:Uncharacterized protein n=1 Tax=Polarella glacialis TaxID=89957 RepID=A0A813EE45_POLGL|nr:unnamed protein product [Polarella glacialis]
MEAPGSMITSGAWAPRPRLALALALAGAGLCAAAIALMRTGVGPSAADTNGIISEEAAMSCIKCFPAITADKKGACTLDSGKTWMLCQGDRPYYSAAQKGCVATANDCFAPKPLPTAPTPLPTIKPAPMPLPTVKPVTSKCESATGTTCGAFSSCSTKNTASCGVLTGYKCSCGKGYCFDSVTKQCVNDKTPTIR